MTAIDATLVARLLAAQHPRWADLPVTLVPHQGWDNVTPRLGENPSVPLPSAPGYASAVATEETGLRLLAGRLPVTLVRDRALSAPIDLGTCRVGDHTCDVVVGWTSVPGEERETSATPSGWTRRRGSTDGDGPRGRHS